MSNQGFEDYSSYYNPNQFGQNDGYQTSLNNPYEQQQQAYQPQQAQMQQQQQAPQMQQQPPTTQIFGQAPNPMYFLLRN